MPKKKYATSLRTDSSIVWSSDKILSDSTESLNKIVIISASKSGF